VNVGFVSRPENFSGLSSTGFSIVTRTGSRSLCGDCERFRSHNPLLGDGTLGFHCGVVDHLGGQDGGGEGEPSSDDVPLGLPGGQAPPPTPPVCRPPPPPAPPAARSPSSSPSSSGSYNSKRKGLSGGATGSSPKSGSIGEIGLSGSLSLSFSFFTEGSYLS